MGKLQDIEDAIVAKISADAIKAKLAVVGTLPGVWDDATWDKLINGVPGAYLSFLGAPRDSRSGTAPVMATRWAVYAVTGHLGGEADRRHGTGVIIGAYEIIERVVPLLDGFVIADIGTLEFQDVANLYSDGADAEALAIYAATFGLPLALPLELDLASLDDFITLDTTWAVGQTPDTVEPQDEVAIPQ